ncbi:hypothetical protein [Nostoc sp.]|uniref:hypothetical protein n=1 Tax=Nostoc sp. TaxID=1180 RepID=UPI002FF8E783
MKKYQKDHKNQKICFVFICQSGELEAKAVLLAASLRHFLTIDHDLVAAIPIPERRWGRLSEVTLEALKLLNVRTIKLQNEISEDYPIGNKLGCLAVETNCENIVFIDSDVIMMHCFDEQKYFEYAISAVPASYTHITFEVWEELYAQFGLSIPTQRMLTEISKEESLAYVNTGFIATKLTPHLASKWINCTKAIYEYPGIPQAIKYRFLDQISFPIAVALSDMTIDFIGREWNFPSWSLSIGSDPMPIFFHYQSAERLLREDSTASLLLKFCQQNPVYKAAITQHQSFNLALSQIQCFEKKPQV